MTNEELVSEIQSGKRDLMPALWFSVEKYVTTQAIKYRHNLHGLETDDFYNSGYIALHEAVKTYKPDSGANFLTWFDYYLKSEFFKMVGNRGKRDPAHDAISIHAPITTDEGGVVELADTLEDKSADLEAVENRIYNQQLRQALDNALEKVPEPERDAVVDIYLNGETLASVAEKSGVDAATIRRRRDYGLRRLRRSDMARDLWAFVEVNTPYYARVSIRNFNTSHTSAVEYAVLKREQLRRRPLF